MLPLPPRNLGLYVECRKASGAHCRLQKSSPDLCKPSEAARLRPCATRSFKSRADAHADCCSQHELQAALPPACSCNPLWRRATQTQQRILAAQVACAFTGLGSLCVSKKDLGRWRWGEPTKTLKAMSCGDQLVNSAEVCSEKIVPTRTHSRVFGIRTASRSPFLDARKFACKQRAYLCAHVRARSSGRALVRGRGGGGGGWDTPSALYPLGRVLRRARRSRSCCRSAA